MKKIIENFFYQTLFQIVKIIVPVLTIPIVSRVLGPSGIGLYNYSYSIANYFALAAGLGITIYGNRAVSLSWNRNEDVSKTFWEILTLKTVVSFIIMICYLIFIVLAINVEDRTVYIIQSLIILAVTFDVSWFFMGIENFKKTSIVNTITQLLTFFCILIFINNSHDILKYTFIQSMGLMLSQLFVWIYIKKYIKFIKVTFKDAFSHFKGAVAYFIPQVAVFLYTNLNKTIVGVFLGTTAVGYYTNSLQLNTVFITIITTLDLVLLPHMSSLFARENVKKIIKLMERTIHLQLFFSIAIFFGMLIVYDKLVPWFFGYDFIFINKLIPFFSILIIICPLGLAISRQYLIPIGKVGQFNRSVIIGAGVNIFFNALLLPMLGIYGVVFANILAELFVTGVRTRAFLKETNFNFDFRKIMIYVFAGLCMFIVARLFTKNMDATVSTNIIQILISIPIYFIITTIAKANPVRDYLKKGD